MAPELTHLALLAVLALIHVSAHGPIQKAKAGNARTIGPPDGHLTGRARRALSNFLETAPVFLCATRVLHLADRAVPMTRIAAAVNLAARTAYLPAYLSGIPWLRTLIWNAATAALAVLLLGIWWQP